MSRPLDNPLDDRLAEAYEEVHRHDEDVIDAVCPAYAELNDGSARYRDEALLGRGGVKDVFRAFDCRTKRWVAMARLRKDRGLLYYDLFVHEAWLVSSLSHPNIIKVHDAGVDADGRPFFTMDLKSNTSLMQLIRATQPPDRAGLLEIFQKVCDAVAYAHSRGVIHLDLKPENIQCDRFGEVMVCDWGLGKTVEGALTESEFFIPQSVGNDTLMGQIKGSLGYMAPEQVVPGRPVDERTDVYALGCILHTLLCGEAPFAGAAAEILKKTEASAIPSLIARYPQRAVPASLDAVVLKATARDPADRYGSVAPLKQEIHDYMSGYATQAERPGFFKEARLFMARNRIPCAIAAASLIILTVLSVLFLQRLGRQQMATEEERMRADQLMTRVDLLSSEYDTLFEQSTVSKKDLAEQLAMAANNLKNLGIYYQPVETLEQVDLLLEMALDLDPGSINSRWQRFMLHCLMLDFEGALSDPSIPGMHQNLVQLAREFESYHFNRERRPSAGQLVDIVRKAEAMDIRLGGYLERVLIYQAATVKERSGISAALESLLALCNGGADHFSMSYKPDDAALEVCSDQGELKFSAKYRKQGGCLLRLIPVRSLRIMSAGTLDLKEISSLGFEMLDLRGCRAVSISKSVDFPQLKTLYMRRGQVSVDMLREKISAGREFEIVEEGAGLVKKKRGSVPNSGLVSKK